MAEEQKNPFPADCHAKFPRLHVFGQLSDATTKEGIEAFLRDHGMEPEYVGVSVTTPPNEGHVAEGVVVIKVEGNQTHAIVPFGMILAVSEGAKDFMVIHPQVFLTFYELDAPTTDAPAA